MVWCNTCQAEVEVVEDEANGFSCCSLCGRVVDEIAFASDLQFTKGADGDGQMVGQMVGEGGQHRGLARYSGGKVWAGGADSHEAAVARGRAELANLVEALHVTPASEALEASHRLYKLALQRGFTRGRRINQVAATCLYIYCRQEKRPYMLIDFSDHLSVNIYTLGSVYLQLLRLFRLDDTAAFTRPVDPSLYLHRFVDRLKLGDKAQAVSATALKLVQSMKRDWMQTGRRPSGICGAALFIAAHIHGCERSKKDIISVVHVGWHTIEKRVVEFAHSQAGDMTLDEFETHAGLLEQDRQRVLLEYEQRLALPAPNPPNGSGTDGQPEGQIVDAQEARMARLKQQEKTGACEHVDAGVPQFAHGMCRACFEEFLVVAGMETGADPPAYTKGILKQIRTQVLALPAPSTAAQLPSPGQQLLLEDARRGSSNNLAGGEDTEATPELRELAPELQEMDEALGREELGKLTRALGGSQPGQEEGDGVAGAGVTSGTSGAGVGDATRTSGAATLGVEVGGRGGPHEGQTTAPTHVAHAARAAAGKQVVASAVHEQHAAEGAEVAAGGTQQPMQGGEVVVELQDAMAKRGRSDAVAAESAAAADDGTGHGRDEGSQGSTKRQKTEVSASHTPAAINSMVDDFFGGGGGGGGGGGDTAADLEGDQQQGMDASNKEVGEEGEGAGKELAVVTGQEEQALVPVEAAEDEDTDHLEDVDDDEVNVYIASAEEAEVKTMLWTEMNKDWLEKQEAKKAMLKRQEEMGITKPKRAGKRAQKALPPAETAEGAAKSMLESKKLSNKINYNALKDLFNDSQAELDRADPAQPQRSMSVAHSAPQLSEAAVSSGNGNSLHGEEVSWGKGVGGEEVGSVTAALKQRAAVRAKEKAQDANKYQAALQREQGRRGSSSALGGGFLGSLTFMSGGKAGEARPRPQSLGSLKPRTK